jgi:hypothetical protein
VELVFNTRTYSAKTVKSADIQTNDSLQPTVKISFSANIVGAQDSSSPYIITPDRMEFAQTIKKQTVTFANNCDSVLNFSVVSPAYAGLNIGDKSFKIKPHRKKEIDFKWKGPFAKADSNMVVTFAMTGSGKNRFSIPAIAKGTEPPPQPKHVTTEPTKPATVQQPDLQKPENKWSLPDSTYKKRNSKE